MEDEALTGKPAPAEIDVLIPVFNGQATIRSSIASIQAQTLANIRIVVVDDGSTDATGVILAELAAADPRLHVVRSGNGGIVDALNRGLAECAADFVARHDADDLAFSERLAKQIAYLRRHPDCIAVGGNIWQIDGSGARNGQRSHFGGDVAPEPSSVPSVEPYLMHPFLMARREALERAGGYRHVFHAEDTDLYWRLFEQGRLHNLPEILGEYRVHDASISGASIVNGRVAAVASQLAAVSFLRRQKGEPDLEFPRDAIKRYVAAGSFRAIVEAASTGLGEDEAAYLQLASAAKLLALLVYRPYLPDAEDCAFMRETLKTHAARLSAKNRATNRKIAGLVGLRLLRNGRLDLVKALAPPVDSMARMFASRSLKNSAALAKRRLSSRFNDKRA